MSELLPYVRTLAIDAFAGKNLSGDYHRKNELIELLSSHIEQLASSNEIEDLVDERAFAEYVFDALEDGKVIRKKEQEFAGTYYRVNNAQLAVFRATFLKQDPIAQTAAEIGDRFFPDVFDGFRAEKGSDLARQDRPISSSVINQQDWAAISANITDEVQLEIRSKVSDLIHAIEQSELDDRTKQNAIKRAEGVIALLEAPDPPWEIVVELLNNRYFTAILNTMAILQLIVGGIG